MFNKFLISKKFLGKFKIKQKNPLALTCEKVTQMPRAYSTAQIKSATENILFIDIEENIFPEITIKPIEYLLKDLFVHMHQTGLYNRQFRLWKSLANIIEVSISRLQKGLFNKSELNAYVIDLFIDPKSQCISTIIDINENTNEFKVYLDMVIASSDLNRLKGIFYFINCMPDEHFISRLRLSTNSFDPISKYESVLLKTNDVRLNVISYYKDNEKDVFKHAYPELIKSLKTESLVL